MDLRQAEATLFVSTERSWVSRIFSKSLCLSHGVSLGFHSEGSVLTS
jgi:hypothetical protein